MLRSKIGRNDPCPCKSGRKFKKCHGRPAPLVAAEIKNNLDNAVRCVRPMFCKSAVQGHELFGGGSGFLVRASGAIWIATAAHVLRDKDYLDLAVPRLIPHGTGPIEAFFHPVGLVGVKSDDPEDTAGFDVVMIRTDEHEHPDALDLERPSFLAPLENANRGAIVRLAGFPRCLDNSIDGPARKARIQLFWADGEYDEPTSSQFLHRFTITDTGKVTDLDGMSGGPLFYVQDAQYFFAGVVVRAATLARN